MLYIGAVWANANAFSCAQRVRAHATAISLPPIPSARATDQVAVTADLVHASRRQVPSARPDVVGQTNLPTKVYILAEFPVGV